MAMDKLKRPSSAARPGVNPAVLLRNEQRRKVAGAGVAFLYEDNTEDSFAGTVNSWENIKSSKYTVTAWASVGGCSRSLRATNLNCAREPSSTST